MDRGPGGGQLPQARDGPAGLHVLLTLLLVLGSALTHAWWNYLLKRAGGGQVVVGLSKLAEGVVCAAVLLTWARADVLASGPAVTGLALVGATLTAANYGLLAGAYARGDLSLVYPVSRGGVLLFLPVLGWLAFGERVGAAGAVAFLLILAGMALLGLQGSGQPGRPPMSRGWPAGLALLAALAAAGYTAWDKHAVQAVRPVTYFAAYTVMVAAGYGGLVLRRAGRSAVALAWARHRSGILQIAVGNMVSYLLVLLALRGGTTSYVIAVRQLSIAVGAVLGWRLLGEALRGPRAAGVALVVGGCVLAAIAAPGS